MSAVDSPQQRTPTSRSAGWTRLSSTGTAPPGGRVPPLVWVTICIGLGVLSALVLPTIPSYDPFSWIVWGREVSDPHLSFVVSGGPSWKPLPFLFTTVWGLFGGAAPTLWVITARIGGLLGLVASWRLASRLTGGGRPGAAAGLLAAVGILITQDWTYYFLRGTSEVGLIACSLWAIDRLLDGHRVQAFWLAIAAGLIRPEWWPFIGVYALWLWFRDPDFASRPMRLMILVGLAALPVGWFGPPWIGSGQPFLAATHAAEYNGHLGSDPFRTVVARGADLQGKAVLVIGIVGTLIGWLVDRSRLVLMLGLSVIAWWVVVVAMTLKGYPGLERFFLPAAALTCVLAAMGIVRVAQLAGGLAGRAAVPVATAVGLVIVAALVPLNSTAVSEARAALPNARNAVTDIDGMAAAVRAAGGHHAVFPCKSSFAAVNHGVQTALAWKLHVTLERVGTTMHNQGVDFVGPHNAANGEAAPVDPRLTHAQQIASVDGWRVVRLTDPNNPAGAACVGR